MDLKWLTAARAKSLSVLIPSIGSGIAIIIAAARPTGFKNAENGYSILREEVIYLRDENRKLHKEIDDIKAWMKDWEDYDSVREKIIFKKDYSSNLSEKLNELNEKKPTLHPAPKSSGDTFKSPPPAASEVF